jgi:hypothetical protein
MLQYPPTHPTALAHHPSALRPSLHPPPSTKLEWVVCRIAPSTTSHACPHSQPIPRSTPHRPHHRHTHHPRRTSTQLSLSSRWLHINLSLPLCPHPTPISPLCMCKHHTARCKQHTASISLRATRCPRPDGTTQGFHAVVKNSAREDIRASNPFTLCKIHYGALPARATPIRPGLCTRTISRSIWPRRAAASLPHVHTRSSLCRALLPAMALVVCKSGH